MSYLAIYFFAHKRNVTKEKEPANVPEAKNLFFLIKYSPIKLPQMGILPIFAYTSKI